MKNMGGKGDYGTEKEVKIKDIDRNGRKQKRKSKIHNKILHQSETKSLSSCRISVFATVKEGVGHFPVGLKLPSGLKMALMSLAFLLRYTHDLGCSSICLYFISVHATH